MKVVISRTAKNVSWQDSLSKVVSKINSDEWQVTENEGSYAQPFRSVRWYGVSSVPCRCVVTAANTNITQFLKVKRSLSASCMCTAKAALSERCSHSNLVEHSEDHSTDLTIVKQSIFHVCPAFHVPVDVVGL